MSDYQIWSWVLTVVGLTGFFLAGRKVWWAWYVNIANQALWAVYAILTHQWGFMVGVVAYTIVFHQNAYRWTTEHYKPKPRSRTYRESGPSRPIRHMRGSQDCVWCGAKTEQWCKDDCAAMDPYDWR